MSETLDQKPVISVKNQFALVGILLASFAAPLCGALNIGAIIDKFNSRQSKIFNIITYKNFVNGFFDAYAG